MPLLLLETPALQCLHGDQNPERLGGKGGKCKKQSKGQFIIAWNTKGMVTGLTKSSKTLVFFILKSSNKLISITKVWSNIHNPEPS